MKAKNVTPKPIIWVWCLPRLSEEELQRLHSDLVAAVVSVGVLGIEKEADLIVLFPPDIMSYGLGTEILVEYVERTYHIMAVLKNLAAKLGNVIRKHFPEAFVQSTATSFDSSYSTRSFTVCWVSTESADRGDVEQVLAVAREKLPELEEKVKKGCYCAANAGDHKGTCGYCNTLGFYRHVIKDGERILGIEDPAEFQAAADVYVAENTAEIKCLN